MVVTLRILMCFAFLGLFADEVIVETLPDSNALSAGRSIEGTIIVTYPADKTLDRDSFSYLKQPLQADFLRRVEVSGSRPLRVDSFRFSLPPLPSGLQTVQPISVRVGGVSYSSVPVAVQIKPLVKASARPESSQKAYLRIESIFKPEGPLYPGQKAIAGYRYLFKGDIELKEEILPLLDKDYFHRLGEKIVEDRQEGDISIREVVQQIEFLEPGLLEVAGAKVAGYQFQDRGWGPKTYFEPLLISETPPFSVKINPFPEAGKPPFFTGALGPFSMSAHMEAPPKLELGDRFTLNLKFQGEGVLSTLKPVNLMCLPGWAGFFRVGDLPPQEKAEEKQKLFSYDVRPTTYLAKEVPSIWYAYFDPYKKTYEVLTTKAIPIEVLSVNGFQPTPFPEVASLVMKPVYPSEANLKNQTFYLPPLEEVNKSPSIFGTSFVLLLIPLALFFAWFRLFYLEIGST